MDLLLSTSANGAATVCEAGDEPSFDIADGALSVENGLHTTGGPEIGSSEEPTMAITPGGADVFVIDDVIVGLNILGHPGQCFFSGVVGKLA